MKKEIISKGLDVADKTITLATKVYDDGLSNPTKTISNGLNMCLEFLGSMVSPTMYEYIQNAEYKKKEIDKKLAKKYESIPKEKRTIPRMNILGPSVELLKYNLDEQYIKDFFINIMTSEMNSDTQSRVLPAYIEIVKQLSQEDAKTLELINRGYTKENTTQFALSTICLNDDESKGTYTIIDKSIIISHLEDDGNLGFYDASKLKSIVIDNLSRLGLINIHEDKQVPDEDAYNLSFIMIKHYEGYETQDIFQKKGTLELTELGKNFIEICLN